MELRRAHPLIVVSLAAFGVALTVPFAVFGLRFTPRAALGIVLLGSAFAVVSAGHLLIGGSWKRHLALALANGPLLLAWWFAAAAMWYFAPGLIGATVLGATLCAPAVFMVLVLRSKERDSSAV